MYFVVKAHQIDSHKLLPSIFYSKLIRYLLTLNLYPILTVKKINIGKFKPSFL